MNAIDRKRQHLGRMTAREVEENFLDIAFMFPLALPTPLVLERALDMARQFSLSHWDSLLVAACAEVGVDRLYTEDMSDEATMLVRLRRISRSEIAATAWDLHFYAHELREFVRMRNLGVAPEEFLKLKVVDARRVYETAHDSALKDYDIPRGMEEVMLYHPFARQFLGYPW